MNPTYNPMENAYRTDPTTTNRGERVIFAATFEQLFDAMAAVQAEREQQIAAPLHEVKTIESAGDAEIRYRLAQEARRYAEAVEQVIKDARVDLTPEREAAAQAQAKIDRLMAHPAYITVGSPEWFEAIEEIPFDTPSDEEEPLI